MQPDKALEHVAIVDDDPDILLIAALALRTIGQLRVTEFSGSQSALRRLSDIQPDMVLLDVMMPEVDGPSTLRAIQARGDIAAMPVVFMTARVQPGEVRHYLSLGAAGVVPKPFDPMTLANELREINQSWRAERRRDDSQKAMA